MGLFSRFKDLVRANVNDVISKAEDPEKSLNLYIEDATEHLRDFSSEVNRFEAERIMTEKRLREAEQAAVDWHEKAKLALEQNREDLARKALEREQHEKDQIEKLRTDLASSEQTSVEMKEQFQLLQEKLQEAKERRDDLVRRNRRAMAEEGAAKAINEINTNDPLSKFDSMAEKVERKEAEARASYTTLTSSVNYEMDQLRKNQNEAEVDDALSQLKAELDKKD
jgi:phage shock protein A